MLCTAWSGPGLRSVSVHAGAAFIVSLSSPGFGSADSMALPYYVIIMYVSLYLYLEMLFREILAICIICAL